MVIIEEYKIDNAIVRVRGRINKKETQKAINTLMEKVDKQRKEKGNKEGI